ncbi:MAG: hypothetical protein KDA24_02695 [Deltaproteobacteria bacterium]|nr:hypothetical protein [Deltaproteobacteria bacterium]
MSLSNPRLAWTVVFAPRRADSAPPPWPSLVTDIVGQVHLPPVDPVTHVLRGPFPVATLSRGRSLAGIRFVVSGAGRAAVLTLVDQEDGEVEGHLRLDTMRARIASTLLGLDVPKKGTSPEIEATPDRLGALLRERFLEDDDWEVLGISEICAALSEGVPEDLPGVDGFQDLGDLRMSRAVGIGQGHVAFTLTGFHTKETDRLVMERRLHVLTQGHLTTVPPLGEYGAYALTWGREAQAGLRLSTALAGVVADVRVAASWAVTGGPIEGGEPDFDRLAARLEMVRVRLKEVVGRLRRGKEELRGAAARVVGGEKEIATSSPFPEASARADRLADRLAEEEEMGARWSEALAVARRASTSGAAD